MVDVAQQINAVRRSVGSRVLEAGEARIVAISQTYDAPIEDVWDACTNPQRIPRWFLPISGDLRLHGRYQLEGNAGGTIERCDPPHSFAATWEYGGDVSWVEVHLSAEPGGRTRFELEHVAHVDDERWAEFGPGAVGVGWDSAVLGLALHLSSQAASGSSPQGASGNGTLGPQEAPAWMASEEGRRFMTLSSQRWGEASIAAGTSEPEARAAAERTTAAYTASPEAPAGA